MHPGRAMRDAAEEYREAGDAGCGGECAGWSRYPAYSSQSARRMMQQENWWRNPFGDGRAGESILEHLRIHR